MKNYRFLSVLIFVCLLVLILNIILPVSAIGGPKEWAKAWTGKGPVPSWWDWSEKYEKARPVRGGVMQVAAADQLGLMNLNHWPLIDAVSLTYMFELAVWYDGNFKPSVPWLIESWEYIDEKTAITKIRKGIRFHDGQVFNAQSLKAQIEYVLDKSTGCWTRVYVTRVKSMEIIDEYTLKWYFSEPWPTFVPNVLANNPTYMMSPKALEADYILADAKKVKKKLKSTAKKVSKLKKKLKKAKTDEDKQALNKKLEKEKKKLAKLEKKAKPLIEKAKGLKSTDVNPVGTGQFMLDEAKPGNYTRFKRNPNWWFGQAIGQPDMPYLDGIQTNVIPDQSVQLANLRAGKIHALVIDPISYSQIKDDKNLKIYIYPINNSWALRFNHAKGPAKDIRVRKAISHAIDRKALVAGIAQGFGEVSSGPYPSIHWAHNPNLQPVKYDPKLSKKLLAEAGYENGLEIKGVMLNWDFSRNTGLAVKNMLAQVGIKWDYVVVDVAAWTAKMRNLEYDLAHSGWAYILDPDLMATGLYHPRGAFNNGRSNNKKAIELIEAGKNESDFEKRRQIYWDFEKALYDNYEDVWLWWPDVITVYRKEMVGFNLQMQKAGGTAYWMSHMRWFRNGKPE